MKCSHCGYEWGTRSDRMFVSCPNCLRKTSKLTEEDKDELKKLI